MPLNTIRPSETRLLLDELRLRPSRALGQNFLVDANILEILMDTVETHPNDCILEIGPGLGVITERMAETARRVIAVEKDKRLWEWLKKRFAEHANIELILGDALAIDHESILLSGVTKVVSNLPYSTGSAILVRLLNSKEPPPQMILTIQVEVARRLAARPGDPEFGLLSLWARLLYEVEIRKIVGPRCFYPAPRVKSAIIRMARTHHPLPPQTQRQMFFTLTKFAFSQRRKQLKTIFRKPPESIRVSYDQFLEACRELNIDADVRPENLSAPEWGKLAEHLVRCKRPTTLEHRIQEPE